MSSPPTTPAIRPLAIRRGHILAAVAIVLLALALRITLTAERAAADPRFYPPRGSDAFTYVRQAQELLAGTWPTEPYYYHPAPAYLYAGLLALTGGSDQPVITLRLAVAALDALTAGWLIASGWLLTRRIWAGWLAGLLFALYPVAIFYGTTLLIAPLAASLVALLTLLILWQREHLAGWRSIALGLTGGALALARLNLAPLILLWPLWLALDRPGWRRWLGHTALTAAAAALVIAPFTLWNAHASGGAFIPVATTGPIELYMANNRDSAGLYGRSPAFDALDTGYLDALARDIALGPGRFMGLLLRKFALFWGAVEVGNNVDYYEVRERSRLLQALPFDFLWLAAPGLLGLAALAYRDRRSAGLLGLMIGWMALGVTIGFAFSRIRHPVVVPLILLTAVLVSAAAEALRKERPAPQGVLRRYALPVALSAALLAFPFWAISGDPPPLPPRPALTALPADAVRAGVTYGGTVELAGWRALPQWWPVPARGWGHPGEAYTVELFWRVPERTATEYHFYLAYTDAGQRHAGIDRAIGAVSYPPIPTDRWQPGEIRSEIVSFLLPEDAPRRRSGRIELGVYIREGDEDAPRIVDVPVTAPAPQPTFTLQTLALYERDASGSPAGEAAPALVFADRIALRNYHIPPQAAPGETLTLRFGWEALADVDRDANLFLHVIGPDDALAAQGDGPPLPDLRTSNWKPGVSFTGEIQVQMPQQPGTYRVYMGLIDSRTGERFAVDAPDNRPLLAQVVVQPPG